MSRPAVSTARESWGQRVRGALLLAACGDALGAPFEGRPVVDPVQVDAWMDAATDTLWWTDDTAQMLVLADHLSRRRGTVDEDELAAELAAEWARDPGRGYGAGARTLFGRLAAGAPWAQASAELFDGQGSFGNGAAMRVAPVGVLAGLGLSAVAARARRSALVTHSHRWAVDGAVVQAVAVALAATSRPDAPIDAGRFVATVAKYVDTAEMRAALRRVGTLAARRCEPAEVAGELGNGVNAVSSVPAALAAFLRHADDVRAALRFAICLGGDTDTIAAMTGALCGARRTEQDLPVMWRLRLEAASRLSTTADALAALSPTWAARDATAAGPGP